MGGWVEGFEGEGLQGVEAGGLGGVEVDEGQEGVDGLIDGGPAEGSFVAVVVGRVDALCYSEDAGDGFDGATELLGDVGAEDAGEGAVVALDAHDAGCGDT